jgi:hypothetical protein
VLAAFFAKVDRSALTAYITSRPTGQYTRRAWFLFEWLTQQRLEIDDLKSVPYVPLVDPDRFLTSSPNRSSRHAIDENLLGTREFSPMVERTEILRKSSEDRLDDEARALVAGYDEDIVKRAVNFLYLSESEFVKLQNIVVDAPYADGGYRKVQNYIGSGYIGHGVVEFVCPQPEDVRSMMSG